MHHSPAQSDDQSLSLLERWRAIETPAVWFILMNCLDMALTYIILHQQRREGGFIYSGAEGNEIANYFLDRWGIKGLFAFKLASAVVVCTIAYVISFKSVTTARRLLAFGTLIVAGVVVYSLFIARFLIHGVRVWPLG